SAPPPSLARTRENRKNARKIGSHLGNPGLEEVGMAKLMKIAQIGFVTFAMMIWTVNAIAQGVNAYFAANGSDRNPCTQAAPCLTLNKASAMSYPPGSTINFRGGDNFTGCWALPPTNVPGGGEKKNPIVVQSYSAGRATMVSNCSGNYNPQLDIAGISGVVVQNLMFQGDGAT